jgi:hypothetical protein
LKRLSGFVAEEREHMATPAPRPKPQVMRLSDAAAERLKEIISQSEHPVAGLRVGLEKGGCAGMEYTMEYAEAAEPHDEIIDYRRQGRTRLHRPEGRAVPLRDGDGLPGR